MIKYGVYFLIVLCGLTLLPGLGRQVMEREQELRVTLTAHDMVETGRWLIPHYQNQPRLKKPPMMYWVVAAAFKMSGTVQSPFVARLPNVGMTMLLLAAIYWASRIFVWDPRAAPLAVLLTSSSFIIQRYARLAETDIAQALFVTLASVACYKALTEEEKGRWWILAGLFSGAGFMFKGPASLVLPLLAAGVFMIARRVSGKPTGWSWKILLLLPVFALIALPWYASLEIMPSTDAIADAAVESEMQALIAHDGTGHPAPFYYYLLRAPVSFLPWGLLIFPAVWAFWKNRREGDGHVFVLGWLISSLVLLSLLYNKQQHYILLLLPVAAVVTAELVTPWINGQSGRMNRFVGGYVVFLLIAASLVSAAAFITPFVLRWLPRGPMMLAGAALAAVSATGWFLLRRKNRTGVMLVTWAAMLAIVYTYIFILHPFHRPETIIPEFVCEAQNTLDASKKVYFIGRKRGTMEFYANHHMTVVDDGTPAALWPQMEPGSALVTVMKIKKSETAEAGGPKPVLEATRAEIRCGLYLK
ncbi:MAG: glycosyltransferase family 39 protein [Kiritimatiellae bacterium]|nr:glycosyltransferase family 39 protein [Kiritimatiellia bacterium]